MKPSTASTQKIFIVGVGRSGTSLLQAILSSHSQINFLPETGYVRKYLFQSTFDKEFSENGNEGVRALIKSDSRLSRLSLNIGDELDSISAAATQASASDAPHTTLDLAIYNKLHEAESTIYSGDKDPRLIEHIELLLFYWPDAKIIHIFRDPRDVIASKKKASWSKAKPLFTQLLSTCAQFRLGIDSAKSVSGKSLCKIQYETLTTSPAQELTRLCEWLAIDFEPRMLDFTLSASKLVFEDEKQWKSEVLGPLLPDNFNKWKNELSDFEIKLTEYSCSETMAFGSYQRHSSENTLLKMAAYLASVVVKAAAAIYRLFRSIKNRTTLRKISGT